MDMLLFPYNNMFALSADKNMTAITYGMKLNGNSIFYTHQPYWKKDFLEMAVSKYAHYVERDNKVLLNEYLIEKKWPNAAKSFLENRLTPYNAEYWPVWYCNFAGYSVSPDATIEIYAYRFDYKNSIPSIIDSSLVYKINAPR